MKHDMPLPVSPRENAVRLRAKALLGSNVVLVPRAMRTCAGGGRTGTLVFGWLVGIPATDGEDDGTLGTVLGVSPPLGSNLDLSQLGTAEEAVADALRRGKEGLGPYAPGDLDLAPPEHVPGEDRSARPARPGRKSEAGLTTSSIDLPGA
jgi:hypothetical protein